MCWALHGSAHINSSLGTTLLGAADARVLQMRTASETAAQSWPTGADPGVPGRVPPAPVAYTTAGGGTLAVTFLLQVARRVEAQAEAAVQRQPQEAVGRSVHIVPRRLSCLVATFLCPG